MSEYCGCSGGLFQPNNSNPMGRFPHPHQHNYNSQSQPFCGHSLCSACLTKLQTAWGISFNQVNPFLMMPSAVPVEQLAKLPIKEPVKEDTKWTKCETHGEKNKLFCMEHNISICTHCYIFGECNHHQVKLITDLKPQIEEKKRELQSVSESISKSVEMAYSKFQSWLTELKSSLKNILDDFPSSEKPNADLKVFELSHELFFFFSHEFKMLEFHYSDIKKRISNKLNEYDSFTLATNPLLLISQDNLSFEESLNNIISNVQKTCEENLEKVSKSLDQMIDIINSSSNVDETPTLLELSGPSPDMEIGPNYPSFPISTLNINFAGQKGERLDISPAQNAFLFGNNFTVGRNCENITLMTFLQEQNPLDSNAVIIRYLQKRLKVKKLEFTLRARNSNVNYAGNLSSYFWNPSLIEELHLITEGSAFSDEDYFNFFKITLPQMKNLTRLSLEFQKGQVGNEAISALVSDAFPNLTKLNTFYFDITGTQVQEDAILELAQNIPLVRSLLLGFNSLPISDQGLIALAWRLKEMDNLEYFEFGIDDSKATDFGLHVLVSNIPEKILNLRLGFFIDERNITGECVVAIFQEKLPSLRFLQNLETASSHYRLNEILRQWKEEKEKERQRALGSKYFFV